MEFPRSNQTPVFHPGSVNQGAFSAPNSNLRPSDFFGRKANLEAGSQGVMALNAIDLGGGGDDGRRGFKPISVATGGVSSNMSFGQGNYSGVTVVNASDSDIMLSLDDILNDLQKKVVSGNNNPRPPGFVSGSSTTQENVHGPLDFGSGRSAAQENVHGPLDFGSERPAAQENVHGPLDFGSGRPAAQGTVHGPLDFGSGRPATQENMHGPLDFGSGRSTAQENVHRRLDFGSGRSTTRESLHGPFEFESGRPTTQENVHGGGVADLPERNEQTVGEVTLLHETERCKARYGGFFSLPGVNEQHRGESAGSHNQHEGEVGSAHNQHEGEVAGREEKSGHQQEIEVVHLQVTNASSGQYSTNEHHNDEAAVFQGEGASGSPHDNDKRKGETTASAAGILHQRKGELPEPVGTNDQEKAEGVEGIREGEILQQAESEMVGGGELQPFVSTPKRGRLVSRKPVEIIHSPEWLPKGWCTEQRTREAGSSAGTKDKYYYDPVSQRRFRSKSEVLSYLETGKVGRYKSKIKSEADGSGTHKRSPSEVLLKNLNSLDPNIRPTKVRWVYEDFDSSWIPFVSEKDLNGYNSKEGEHKFDLNHNGGDACKE